MTVATGALGTGKGTNLLAIFHAALDLGAERVVVLDGDVRSGRAVVVNAPAGCG